MRNATRRLSPIAEALEPKQLLSGAMPALTMNALNRVAADVGKVMGTLARTGNMGQANAALTHLSSRIPFGVQELAPTWQGDLGNDQPGAAPPGTKLPKQLLNDLYRDVLNGVGNGEFRVAGPGATICYVPTPMPPGTWAPPTAANDYSFMIRNQTGLDLTVSAQLRTPGAATVFLVPPTDTIPNKTTHEFDFGPAYKPVSGRSIFVQLTNRNHPRVDSNNPTPVPLFEPSGGYQGALYTITLTGTTFTITQSG